MASELSETVPAQLLHELFLGQHDENSAKHFVLHHLAPLISPAQLQWLT